MGMRLVEWHIKSTTKASQGLYEYDVPRLRDHNLEMKNEDIAIILNKENSGTHFNLMRG